MKFLKHTTMRVTLDYDIIHDLRTAQIIGLRNQLSSLRDMRKSTSELDVWIEFKDKDFQTVWMNQGLENQLIEGLNSMIIKRRTKKK